MPPLPDVPADAARGAAPEGLVEVGRYGSADAGFERGLVVLALGWGYWLAPADGDYRLLVEPPAAAPVREELARFERESVGWPPAPPPAAADAARADLLTPLLWALVVLASFRAQAEDPRWVEAGALEAAAVFGRGEWWRTATALFLHADLAHLTANLLSGVAVFPLVLATFGRARGWLLLAASAVAGNAAAAAIHLADEYRSIGASTAVFAALGLLTGAAVRRVPRHDRRRRWRAALAPLGSGVVVLALFGAGEMRIDVLAHATGFIAGLVLGFAAPALSRDRTHRGSGTA